MSRFISFPVISAGLVVIFLVAVGFQPDTLPHNPQAQFSDAAISRWPDALHFQRSIRDHQTLPLWNNHLMAGQPFAANPGTKVFYPLTWLLLVWSPAVHINMLVALHLWWGALGMWRWASATGLDTLAAWLAGLAYLLAPKLMAHAGVGHTDLLIAMAWLPWLMLGLHHNHIGLAGFAGAFIFIGAIQLTPYAYGLALVYVIWQRKLHAIWAGLLGVGLAAIQWVPLLELRNVLSRGDIRVQDAAIFSTEPGQLLGLVIGDHSGTVETLTYVGIAVFILALVGLVLQPRQHIIWWGVVIVAVLYSLGDNFVLWRGLVEVFPPLLAFRVPSRAWFLVAFLLPYLAGWGLQTLLHRPPRTARSRLLMVGLSGAGVVCSLASWIILQEALAVAALIGLVALPATLILIALWIFERIPAATLGRAFVVLIVLDGLWMGASLIEGRDDWQPDVTLPESVERLYTPSYSIPQQTTADRNIARFDGVDPFQLSAFIDASLPATGVPRDGYSTTVPAVVVLSDDQAEYQDAPLDVELLGAWGVDWIVADYALDIASRAFEDNDLFYYENPLAWGDDVQLIWDGPNRVRQSVNTDRPVMTIANAPGWETEDGAAIDPDLVALPAETGTYVYRPDGIWIGALLSGLALVGGIYAFRKR